MNRFLRRPGCILFACCLTTALHAENPAPVPSSPCSAPAYHSFDFWIGDWDVFDAHDGSKDSHVLVERVLGGCALREQYHGVDGTEGESLSAWDQSQHVWHQYWVSSGAEIVVIEGDLHAGSMILTGSQSGTHPAQVRGVWKPEGATVRETAQRSHDGGKTWQPWFDLQFRRSASAPQEPQ